MSPRARAFNSSRLWRHDRRLAGEAGMLGGVDEVGRGPLAGAVVAACVVLDLDARPIHGVNDSKKVPPERRAELAPLIRERALAWCVAEASVAEIDALNIYHASHLAMRRALEGVVAMRPAVTPSLVLVDGNRAVSGVTLPQKTLVGGDALSACIAAASILAKVERDRALEEADALYPMYGFARHKGYATVEHREALRRHGPCPLHRRSFSLADAEALEMDL